VLDGALEWAPIGVPGEVHIGGAGVTRGYLGRPGLTAERFVPDPFGAPGSRLYRTGDRARWSSGGELEFLGRLDFQVKIRGVRIELGEIEAALGAHPAVSQCVVMARSDTGTEQRLVAYLVGDTISVAALRGHLVESLSDYMIPSAFVWLDAIPLTPNGKVDREALPAPELDREALSAGFVAPRTAAEAALAAVWAELLGVDAVGVHDDFFELGGDSILTIRVAAGASRAGIELTPRQVFEAPTVAGLAAVAGCARGAMSTVVWLAGGDERPLVLLPPLGGAIASFPALARALRSSLPVFAVEDPALADPAAAAGSIAELAERFVVDLLASDPGGGPWRLAGYSAGSVLAVEIAGRLGARGHAVEHVVLLDGGCPVGREADEHDSFDYVAVVLEQVVADPPSADTLRAMGVDAAVDCLAGAFAGAAPPDGMRRYASALVAAAERQARHLGEWRPPAVDAPITLLRTVGDREPDYGWGRALGRPIEVMFVPGDHGSMMREPMVRTLARVVESVLGPAEGPAETNADPRAVGTDGGVE